MARLLPCSLLLFLSICLLCTLGVSVAGDGITAPGASPAPAVDPCASGRYLLYSIQRGEGFSLRRDAFVRMGAALMMSPYSNESNTDGRWSLVLPPLSSVLSPQWGSGVQHVGIGYVNRPVPYSSLWDMNYLAQETGLRFLEYNQYVAISSDGSSSSERAVGQIDQVLHLCGFHYNEAFNAASHLAGKDGNPPAYPGSTHPRSHLFREFACMRGARPDPQEGYCGTPLPAVHKKKGQARPLLATNEYGELALPRGKHASIHCGMANLMPSLVAPIVEEHLSPAIDTAAPGSARPVCSAMVTNTQLIFWNPPPHPLSPPDDPAQRAWAARTRFLRALRLAAPLQALVHSFIYHVLQAAPVRPLNASNNAEAIALLDPATRTSEQQQLSESVSPSLLPPPYLAIHARRGDFTVVHQQHIPDLPHLAWQVLQRFRREWQRRNDSQTSATHSGEMASSSSSAAASAAAPLLLSNKVFLSSDMSGDEFASLQRMLEEEQGADASFAAGVYPHVELVRFDVGAVSSSPLRDHWSSAVQTYLAAAASTSIPLTPFHVLLLDQLLLEQSLGEWGFIGTQHSYVSEMVWQQRKAHRIEQADKWSKEVLDAGTKPTTAPHAGATSVWRATHHAHDAL